MKLSKSKRRILMGAAGLVLAGVVFAGEIMSSVVDVQATTRVLDGITTKYTKDSPIKILEIVDSDANDNTFSYTHLGSGTTRYGNKKSEMGYFMPTSNSGNLSDYDADGRNSSTTEVPEASRGFVHGIPSATRGYNSKSDAEKQEYIDYMLRLYTYGLVKPNGTDTGWVSKIGEYPIYGKGALFSANRTNSCTLQLDASADGSAVDINFAKGVYTPAADNKGNFQLIESYTDNGQTYYVGLYIHDEENVDLEPEYKNADVKDYTICTYRTEERTVSGNDIGDPSVSNNDPSVSGNDPQTVTKTYKIYKPITIDTSKLGYPSIQVSGTTVQLIQRSPEQNGNLNFNATEITTTTPYMEYYGPNNLQNLWLNIDGDSKGEVNNSDWLSEYVLGSNKKFKDTDAVYDVVPASQVSVEANSNGQSLPLARYDLVYISGKAVNFKDCDLDMAVVVALYENTTNHLRQAIMMDYACYSGKIETRLDVLCGLLWQTKETKVGLINADAGRSDTEKLFTVSTGEFKDKVTNLEKSYTEYTLRGFTAAKRVVENGFQYTVKVKDETSGTEVSETKTFKALKDTMMDQSFGNGNFVTGNVYVYDHAVANFDSARSFVDAHDNFANGDLISKYTAKVTTTGLYSVENYITVQNKNSLSGAMSTEITPAVCIQYILISEGEDVASMKTSLNILEIQPVPSYLYNKGRGSEEFVALSTTDQTENAIRENRKKFVSDYLPNYYSDKLDYIGFTSMTVYEFNGHNEDLVEKYDIIYIGDETTKDGVSLYNLDYRNKTTNASAYAGNAALDDATNKVVTKKSRQWNEANKKYETIDAQLSYFTDNSLTGNIYYNVGDIVDTRLYRNANKPYYLFGHLDGEDITAGITTGISKARYPGRDINGNKVKKLKEFLQSNGLVIVAENLMGPTSNAAGTEDINPTIAGTDAATVDTHGFVDSSSNLYEFLKYGLGYCWDSTTASYVNNNDETTNTQKIFGNLVSAASIKMNYVDKADLTQYISAEKVSLVMYDMPKPYSYTTQVLNGANGVIDEITYSIEKEAEDRTLRYEFEISSDSSVTVEQEDDETGGTIQTEAGYVPTLYIDINNDGKYSQKTEAVADVTITYTNEQGQTVEAPKNADGTAYNLVKGVRYTMERKLSDDFKGLVNWKLSVENAHVSTLHASEQGYTAVEAKNDKVVNVLQLNQNNDYNNLETYLETPGTDATKLKWNSYMENVPGYELHIKTITQEDFRNEFSTAYNNRTTDAKYKDIAGIAAMSVEEFAVDHFFKDYVIDDEQTGVNMLVIGFGDSFASLYNELTDSVDNKVPAYRAVDAIYAFIEAGYPVLASHDFLDVRPTHVQTQILRDSFGQDKYAVTKNLKASGSTYTLTSRWSTTTGNKIAVASDDKITKATHSGVGYTWGSAGDNAVLQALWKLNKEYGKEIAYEPNSLRRTTTKYTQGFSNYVVSRSRNDNDANSDSEVLGNRHAKENQMWWLYNLNANLKTSFSEYYNTTVTKLNDGQITTYPYILPDEFSIVKTHSQWHELDLSTDADQDGESDVVVWYALSDLNYSDTDGGSIDPANGYYIYNKGNITYTGAGDTASNNDRNGLDGATEPEMQMFINTLLATFETGNNKPGINIYESADLNAKPINSIVVPYDGNVTDPAKRSNDSSITVNRTNYDSSVLVGSDNYYKYQFVDPNTSATDTKALGTLAYFRINDLNFVRGTKQITLKYYLAYSSKMAGKNVKVNVAGGTQTDRSLDQTLTVDGETYAAVDISDVIETYAVANGKPVATAIGRNEVKDENGQKIGDYITTIKSNDPYAFYLPMNYLEDEAQFTIIVEAETKITSVSTEGGESTKSTEKGYKALTVTKTDLLDLD